MRRLPTQASTTIKVRLPLSKCIRDPSHICSDFRFPEKKLGSASALTHREWDGLKGANMPLGHEKLLS
jgi:hypothetical protein